MTELTHGIQQSRVLLPAGATASRRVLIFANPIAGRGKGAKTAKRLGSALTAAGFQPELVFDRPDKAKFPNGPIHAAISIGGDGTLRAVVSRLSCFDSECATPPPPILVIPTGTANLMKQSLGIAWDDKQLEHRVVDAIRDYHLVPRDAAVANGQLFLIVAGAGLDGQIIHELEKRRRGPINLLHYALPSALSVKVWKYVPITVELDGKRIFGPEPGMAMVGNVKEHGIGFSFLAKAVPDDGLLDVLCIPCKNLFTGFEMLLHAAAGQLDEQEGVVYATGKKCRIDADEPIAVQADGEAGGFTPLEVELLGFQVPFIVPK